MLPLWMLYILRPLKYHFAKEENENLNQNSEKAFFKDKRFYYPLHTYVALESIVWIWALVVCSDSVNIESPWFDGIKPHTLGEWFQFTLVLGYFAGLNAIVGHELVHKREWYNKLLGTFSYTKFMYSHFLQEHIHGHHKDVATPNDPCSANYGETVYQFIPRSFFGQHLQSWQRETKRIKKVHGENVGLVVLIFFNKNTWFLLLHSGIFATIYLLLGLGALKYQLAYTFWGTIYLETINYIEHYGLKRKQDQNGIYESINNLHSWNS